MMGHDLLNRRPGEITIADVALMHRCLAVRVTNRVKCLPHSGFIAINQGDESAFTGEQQRTGAADAGARTRDNRDPVLQPHVTFLPRDESTSRSSQPRSPRSPTGRANRIPVPYARSM